ncbi:MAG TPA: Ku protein [Syntrophales bacterium]|nr:Ku protein [Syntrophales bacterium]
MRTEWKGYLKFRLVTIPIKMYGAITAKKTVPFHLLHKTCKSRIRHQNFCPTDHRVVTDEEIIRGYEYGKDMYVIVTDEDIEKAKIESTEVIEVLKMVQDDQIGPIYYSGSHYLAPDGSVAAEAFVLFLRAMEDAGRTALARVVLRNREHLFAIKPYNGVLIAYSLHYPEQIIGMDGIEGLDEVKKVKIDAENVKMARDLIKNMSGDFVPGEFTDQYNHTLMEIIRTKAEGGEIKVTPRVEGAKVINLMDALKKSVQESQARPEKARKGMATAGLKKLPGPKRKKEAHA